jgi:hypothetical protein
MLLEHGAVCRVDLLQQHAIAPEIRQMLKHPLGAAILEKDAIDKLVSTSFSNSCTRGFAAVGEPNVAVCLLPGTEIAFEKERRTRWYFRALLPEDPRKSGAVPSDLHGQTPHASRRA